VAESSVTTPESARFGAHFDGFDEVSDEPWVVMGGGGLKGVAHVGAWRAMEEAGIRPKGIIGTSIGALIGALASSGMSADEMTRHVLELERTDIVRINRRTVWINGLRQLSVFRGDALREYFEGLLPLDGWQSLDIPVLINAVDLSDGSTEWFGTGARTDVTLVDAVYASSALPVFYPPFQVADQAFVDGGTAHPLPLIKACEEGAERIIAIDVGSGETGNTEKILRQGLLAVHQRIFSIMTWRRRRSLIQQWKGPPLLYVRPRLSGYATFDFDNLEYFLEEGYRATRAALGS
jgi:NTE family protein